eukprot:TRINITY_DN10090_c0_g2_i1.p1 TRINITY_DN10090_c0_g2~~TRINITY_DN10090_c0_g2_i1.p1  ORF type:complete len:579 (+),score=138.76 TRINITY_DN10090_c0_g2_i1:1149-2885(+)
MEINTVNFNPTSKTVPKCLVIDEIDGILGGDGNSAIEALVSLMDEKPPKRGKKKREGGPSKDKARTTETSVGSKTGFRLHRPIICICNDPWVPALRSLKERAFVIKLPPPNSTQLVKRLSRIVASEKVMGVDSRLLMGLCELTGNDIRSSINTLQFLSRLDTPISSEILTRATFGTKDMTDNIFDIWNSIFVKKKKSTVIQSLLTERFNEQKTKFSDHICESGEENQHHFENLYNVVQQHGGFDKIIVGTYHNYLSTNYNDPMLTKTLSILNWFEFFSLLESNQTQFSLLQYLPCVSVAVHHLCHMPFLSQNQIKYPRALFQLRSNMKHNIGLARNVVHGASPQIQQTLPSLHDAITEFLPWLHHVIDPFLLSPKLEGIACTTHQKSKNGPSSSSFLHSLGITYLDYGLSFKETKMEEGSSSGFTLAPSLDSLVLFSRECLLEEWHRNQEHFQLKWSTTTPHNHQQPQFRQQDRNYPPKICHVIISEIQKVRDARKKEQLKISNATEKDSKVIQTQPTKPVPQPEARTEKKDFFGRVIKTVGKTSEVLPHVNQPRVFFKYQNGLTNAIKRKVYLTDFL